MQATLSQPAQLGFGFEVCDAQGKTPGFLHEPSEVHSALQVIAAAAWVSVDVETTGLTDASVPVDLGWQAIKQGAIADVRMRTIQARIPTVRGRRGPRKNYAFDCDKMGPSLTAVVARTLLSRQMLIAHNAGFDLYWLRRAEGRLTMPRMVVDTMLLTRLLCPELVLERAYLVRNIAHIDDVQFSTPVEQAAWKSLMTGASGGSLADVVLAMFGVVVDKTYQKPNNWTGLLGFGHYDYAIDDVVWADKILCRLLDLPEDGDVYQAYCGVRARKPTARLIEPQVPELVLMREHGMPVNTTIGRNYVRLKRFELARRVSELIDVEPVLESHREALSDPDAGLDEELKQCLAKAFERRGVTLRRTAATSAPQVGEKDLRACRAAQIADSRPLFNAWVAVCRAKKTSAMALEVVGFAERSVDGLLRSLMSHGPVTGRLSSSDCNVQQWPRDQLFRAMCISGIVPGCETLTLTVTAVNKDLLALAADRAVTEGESVSVETAWMGALFFADKHVPDWPKQDRETLQTQLEACFTHRIVASDFSALDVRVGAALCIRAQREMLRLVDGYAVPGPIQPPEPVVAKIREIGLLRQTLLAKGASNEAVATALAKHADKLCKKVELLEADLEKLKDQLDAGVIRRSRYWKMRSELKELLLAEKLGWRLAQCLSHGAKRGEAEYSALRDAFVVEIDIHTFTGLKLAGRDPLKEFDGLSSSDRKALEKKLKKELGPRRQQGKIANLSLLYGMADAGFQEAAARGYDEHWTLEEAASIRSLWMNAYPEVELWHLWTECLQVGTVYIPEQGRDKPVRTGWWMARTLADRDIVAFGLNAALSYQDQSSGADILGMIMHRFHTDYPSIFDCTINQVHDELVFLVPADKVDSHLPVIETVMNEEANKLLMPYGVPGLVSPATSYLWVKD